MLMPICHAAAIRHAMLMLFSLIRFDAVASMLPRAFHTLPLICRHAAVIFAFFDLRHYATPITL